MKHWSTDTKELEKDPTAYAVWRLEQRINWGLGEEKIRRDELKAHWSKLDIDPQKKKYLAFLLKP